MKRIFSVMIIGILCFSMFSIFTPQVRAIGSWATKASVPQPLAVHSTAAANGKVYAIGGQYVSGDSLVWLNTNFEYDPVNDNWVSKASMPTARTALAALSVNDKIYVIGGAASFSGGALSTNEEYDPSTDNWATKASMPTPRDWISAAVVNDKIYVIGGSDNSGGIYSMNEMYDPLTNTWTTMTPDPQNRLACGIGVANGKIYLIGGWIRPGAPPGEPTSLNEEYDPETDTWTTKAPMPTARNGLAVVEVNDRLYAIGGATDFNPWTNNLNVVEEYDPSTDAWTTVESMPTSRSLLGAAVVNNKIYSIGGMGSSGYLDTNEEFSGTSGLVGYWKFDEGSGSIAYDSSGSNDGVVRGIPSWTTGVVGGALRFDGAQNNYVAMSSQLDVTDGITVETWIYPEFDPADPAAYPQPSGCAGRQIIRKSSCGDDTFFIGFYSGYYFNPTNPVPYISAGFFYQGGGGANIEPVLIPGLISQGHWYHIVATFRRNDYLRLYVNGVEQKAVTTEDKPLRVSSRHLTIGQEADVIGGDPLDTPTYPQTWIGKIDEAKIYDYARTAEQIHSDYVSSRPPTKWAVILGDDEYKRVSSDIEDPSGQGPVSSATDTYNLLVNRFGFPSNNVHLLCDKIGDGTDDINKANIIDELDWLDTNVGPKDLALFYYAGHGWQDGDRNHEYIIPHDRHAIRDDDFTDYINQIDAEKLVIILDMSFSGGFITDGQNWLQGLLGISPSDTDLAGKPSGRIVLTACAEDINGPKERGKTRDAFSASFDSRIEMAFSHYLIKGFNGEGDFNFDGKVTVEEAFRYARIRCFRSMTPMMYDAYPEHDSSGDLYLG